MGHWLIFPYHCHRVITWSHECCVAITRPWFTSTDNPWLVDYWYGIVKPYCSDLGIISTQELGISMNQPLQQVGTRVFWWITILWKKIRVAKKKVGISSLFSNPNRFFPFFPGVLCMFSLQLAVLATFRRCHENPGWSQSGGLPQQLQPPCRS